MDPVVQEQIAYYRARAQEHEEWFLRRGRYDLGQVLNARWRAELDEVDNAVEAFAPGCAVLEVAEALASGTKNSTLAENLLGHLLKRRSVVSVRRGVPVPVPRTILMTASEVASP